MNRLQSVPKSSSESRKRPLERAGASVARRIGDASVSAPNKAFTRTGSRDCGSASLKTSERAGTLSRVQKPNGHSISELIPPLASRTAAFQPLLNPPFRPISPVPLVDLPTPRRRAIPSPLTSGTRCETRTRKSHFAAVSSSHGRAAIGFMVEFIKIIHWLYLSSSMSSFLDSRYRIVVFASSKQRNYLFQYVFARVLFFFPYTIYICDTREIARKFIHSA